MLSTTDKPDNAPDACPGLSSESAGKASACQGCPNQSACESGEARKPLTERDPALVEAIKRRLANVKHCLLILSGKGGVGKSSVAVCLARALAWQRNHRQVRLLDLDLCGPSIPCMLGCLDEQVHQSQQGWSPVFVSPNLAAMSIGFLLTANPDQPIIWRGPRKTALIKQLLTEVDWSTSTSSESGCQAPGNQDQIDFLLIDTPPGTSDEHLSVVQYLTAANCIDGALLVTTPQEVALGDVRKEVDFCRKANLSIIGIVENMSEFRCPSCHYTGPLFPPTTGGAASLTALDDDHIDLLGQLPLDPRLAHALDEGWCPFEMAESNSVTSGDGDPCDPSYGGDMCQETRSSHNNTLRIDDPIIKAYLSLVDKLTTKLAAAPVNSC